MDQSIEFKSLGSYEKHLKALCPQNKLCTDPNCNKLHPRCFASVCIDKLQNGKCSKDNCKLTHFDLKNLKTEFKIDSINGIFRFNLCSEQKCTDQKNCPFIHIKWAENYCVQYFNDECTQEDNHLEHIEWLELMKKVHKEKSLDQINPENICLQSFETCRCKYHLPNADNVCLMFFKGLCPNLQCLKQHIFWDDYLTGLSSKKIIQNCIFLHKTNPIPKGPSQVFLKQQELLRIKREVEDSSKIDIIFIMDCTGSMANWIAESSKQIYTIINNFQKQVGKFIRVGFIGYRDFGDKQKLSIHDLTCDLATIKQYISDLKAEGGADEAEDVYGALEQVFKLNITSNKESLLITFLFADAPTHGIQYHEEKISDSHPNQPVNSLEDLMQKYYKIKEKNFFYCVKINDSTDKMFDIMKKNFPGLEVTEKQSSEGLSNIVQLSLTQIYTQATHTKITQRLCMMIGANFLKPKSIKYYQSDSNNEDKQNYWKQFTSNLWAKYLRKQQTKLIIYTEIMTFNKGAEGTQCCVYEIKDRINNRTVLAKIPKYVVEEYTQKSQQLPKQSVKLQDETLQRAKQENYIRFEQLVVARQLAIIYRKKTRDIQGAPPIYYVSPIIYTLDEPFMGLSEIYAETYIDKPTDWIKYSNNTDYVHPDHHYMTSFSHFTFEETQELLLINDLQGKFNILSDPSIQTTQQISEKQDIDKTNRKLRGIVEFQEKQHSQCNQICKQLGLKSFKNNSPIKESAFNVEKNQPIYFICENCNEFRDISQDLYKLLKKEKCEYCLEEEKLLDQIQCKCCKDKFQIPAGSYHIRGTKIECCDDCKTQCNSNNQKCFYCNIDCTIKVQNKKIGGQKISVCKKALEYLNAIQCYICYSRYDYAQLIQQDDYVRGYYKCEKCRRI